MARSGAVRTVRGVVRGRGKNQTYVDGVQPVTVHFLREENPDWPYENSVRIEARMKIGANWYTGGVLLRTSPPPLVSLCPDLVDEDGVEVRLADLLSEL